MANESIESANDTQSQHIVQNFDEELTSRVCISLSMQRNLGNYENCHFSIRYEQNCKPEDRQALTETLEQEASAWIKKRSHKVDDYLQRKSYGQSENESPSYQQGSR